MEIIEKSATAKTPYVHLNAHKGEILIEGRAIPQSAEEFWAPILKWVYLYANHPCYETKLVFNVAYFNNASIKQILFLLDKLNEIFEQGCKVSAIWKYTKDDIEMKEVGFDFSCMVNFPFEFTSIDNNIIEYS